MDPTGCHRIPFLWTLCLLGSASAVPLARVRLLEESRIADNGLYFAGAKDEAYHFSPRITPHGDCLTALEDRVWVAWYEGGMDRRNLMLSRHRIGSRSGWQTLRFPDRHIGYRGDPTLGDSHNTAAVGICPRDRTIHLLYDMHAYSRSAFPEHYFNYRVSVPGAVDVPDARWSLTLFSAKLHALKPGLDYERTTYPKFIRDDSGRLLAYWRHGGSGNGDSSYAVYDGTAWSDTLRLNHGNQPDPKQRYSIYGSPAFHHASLHWVFAIRYRNNPAFALNNGLFYAYAPGAAPLWYGPADRPLTLPIEDPGRVQVGEPCALGLGNRMSSAPAWTVSTGAWVHALARVSGGVAHYIKAPNQAAFEVHLGGPDGALHNLDRLVLLVQLDHGRVRILATPEGGTTWTELYRATAGPRYRFFRSTLVDRRLILCLMEEAAGDAQPLDLQIYTVDRPQAGVRG